MASGWGRVRRIDDQSVVGTAAYRLCMSLPRAAWPAASTNVDIADCPRSEWHGPDYLLRRLAALNRDPYAQWLGGELDRAGVTANTARWLNLLWYDPSVIEQPPDQLPKLQHFEDMGLVSARSGWDGNEALLVFKCGDGLQWFDALAAIRPKANPRILAAISNSWADKIIGDSTSIYPATSGLPRFVRRLLWIRPNCLLVFDNVEPVSPLSLELCFHTEFPCVPGENGSHVASGKKTNLRIDLLTLDQATMIYAETQGKDRDGNTNPIIR